MLSARDGIGAKSHVEVDVGSRVTIKQESQVLAGLSSGLSTRRHGE